MAGIQKDWEALERSVCPPCEENSRKCPMLIRGASRTKSPGFDARWENNGSASHRTNEPRSKIVIHDMLFDPGHQALHAFEIGYRKCSGNQNFMQQVLPDAGSQDCSEKAAEAAPCEISSGIWAGQAGATVAEKNAVAGWAHDLIGEKSHGSWPGIDECFSHEGFEKMPVCDQYLVRLEPGNSLSERMLDIFYGK